EHHPAMNRTKRLLGGAALLLLPVSPIAGESRTLIMGVWPNELRLMDEGSEEFIGTIPLRYGAVTGYGRTPHTPDYRRLYYITDRMEAVEVVDPEAMQVIDELRLSTAARRVRILGVSPYPDGSKLILRVVAVGMDIDRFETDEAEYLVYDLHERAVKASFHLPKEVRTDFTSPFPFSSDGKTFFAFGRDVFELSAATHEVVSKIVLATPLEAGYGPTRPFDLYSPEPGIYYGLARTSDPFLKKAMTGVLRLDLKARTASSLEIGPEIKANVFALSPDGKTGYAGVTDLAKIDMVSGRIVALKKGFLEGRAATVLILSGDGTKLFITGIGNAIQVVDAESLELKRTIALDRDLMANPLPLPASASRASR
ncbi:MAG TPA: hypothetical protein VJ921_06710, partial [Vicinamibacteria bacterium]|nr:hypothetical protein [Vicinamibacteria bacterium]